METWSKYLPFLVFSIVILSNAHITNTIGDYKFMKTLRVRRQSGYVYDKPNVSFNLPTQTIATTTQATAVDRIPTQMYYAYPAPAQGNAATAVSSAGYSNDRQITGAAQPGPSAGNVGYTNTGSTAIGTSAIVSTSTGSGYSYESQVTQPQSNIANIGVSSGGSTAIGISVSESGYNYERQNSQISQPERTAVNVGIVNTGSITSGTAAGGSAYNYEKQNTDSNQLGRNNVNQGYSSASVISGNSAVVSSGGYNYDRQNTGSVQSERSNINIGGSGPTTKGGFSFSGRSGYNYEKQNTIVTQPVTNYQQSGYDSVRPVQNTDISTKAPKYLPPTNINNENVAVTVDTGPVNVPLVSYLPPETPIRTQTVINQQAGIIQSPNTGYLAPSGQDVTSVKQTNVVDSIQTTTSSPVVQQPSFNYLPPNTQTSNVPLTEPQQTYLAQPAQNQYLPPVPSYTTTKTSISTPASMYLPPVL